MIHKNILLAMRPTRLRDDLSYQLQHSNFEVIHVCDGGRVIKQIRRYPLDTVVLEMDLPGFDGLELILSIKDFAKHLPIITISDDHSFESNILKAGGSAMIPSSTESQDIIQMINQMIGVEKNAGESKK